MELTLNKFIARGLMVANFESEKSIVPSSITVMLGMNFRKDGFGVVLVLIVRALLMRRPSIFSLKLSAFDCIRLEVKREACFVEVPSEAIGR